LYNESYDVSRKLTDGCSIALGVIWFSIFGCFAWSEWVLFFTSMEKVKNQGRSTKISVKHQVTIPIDAMRIAGLEAGERVMARAEGPGRVVLERQDDVLERFSGSLTGVFDQRILDQLRNEWD
jgi:bifunctional DNA-binding transcriptional regulator/antitoxin component of YhaV-PrlF toxin-antitoxin module